MKSIFPQVAEPTIYFSLFTEQSCFLKPPPCREQMICSYVIKILVNSMKIESLIQIKIQRYKDTNKDTNKKHVVEIIFNSSLSSQCLQFIIHPCDPTVVIRY